MTDRLTLLERQQKLLDEMTDQIHEHDVLLTRVMWCAWILGILTIAYFFGLIPSSALFAAIGVACLFAGYWAWRTRQLVQYMEGYWKAQARLLKLNS